ncbi:hypothetical protein L218DRAFT_1010326 [Marasmius fiardii PR-910]|nr:hypothetical protein L218DRAFT_1010326 [Marasmius fiardii PR-910]
MQQNNHLTCQQLEILHTLDLLEEETKELKWFEIQIALLRTKLEEMEAGKRDLETHTERRRPVVSAQRRVPAEI